MHFSSLLTLTACLVLVEITRGQRRGQTECRDSIDSNRCELTNRTQRICLHPRKREFCKKTCNLCSSTEARTGQYTRQTVTRREKLYQRWLRKQLHERRRLQAWRTTRNEHFKCEDRLWTLRCEKHVKRFGGCAIKPGDTHATIKYRRQLQKRCAKTCGGCKVVKEVQREQPQNDAFQPRVQKRRQQKQPFPHIGTEVGDRDTPRRGIYYIYTKRIYLK